MEVVSVGVPGKNTQFNILTEGRKGRWLELIKEMTSHMTHSVPVAHSWANVVD